VGQRHNRLTPGVSEVDQTGRNACRLTAATKGYDMATQRIPPLVIQQWGKIKHDLVSTIQKAKGPGMTPDYKKDLTKKVETLFTTFDSGLRDKLKKASETKNDADAKKALQDVIKISTDYLTKLKAAQAQWGTNGRGAGDIIEKNLVRIKDVASTTLKAMG
jgi:hypothetical protein